MSVLGLRHLVLLLSIFSMHAHSEGTVSSGTNEHDFLHNFAKKYPGYQFKFELPINVYDKKTR